MLDPWQLGLNLLPQRQRGNPNSTFLAVCPALERPTPPCGGMRPIRGASLSVRPNGHIAYPLDMPPAEQDANSGVRAGSPGPPFAEVTARLLEKARAGDEAAFDRLFARAIPRLRWFLSLRLGSGLRARLEPDDVVQETYAAALPLLPDFESRGEGAFVRWLFAIGENQIRRLTAHHRAKRRSGPAPGGPADAALSLAADPASGPCTCAARVERRALVSDAIRSLPEDQRDALLLRLIEGRPVREVAATMERSESAIRRLVVRAVDALGHQLRGQEGSHG